MLVTMEEQRMDIQPPTAVIQAITRWAAVLEDVTLQEAGLGVNLPVKVCCYFIYFCQQVSGDVFLHLTAVDCGTLTNPANGSVTHSGGTTFRHTATYSCNAGYSLVGDSTRTCQATRRWSGSVPTCQRMLLMKLASILC